MATDLSESAPLPIAHDDGAQQPLVNGNHAHPDQTMDDSDTANADSFLENNTLHTKETTINVKDATATALDPNLSEPTPTEDVVTGIQPVADFIPKGAPALSHPTPPPDQPLVASEVDVDAAMADAEDIVPAEPQPAPEPILSSEPSLVRPREDDEDVDEEPAAKRSRVADAFQVEAAVPLTEEAPTASSPADAPTVTSTSGGEADVSAEAVPAVEADQPVPAPDDAPVKATNSEETVAPVAAPEAKQLLSAPEPIDEPAAITAPQQPTQSDVKPSVEAHAASRAGSEVAKAKYSTAPMTPAQKHSLLDKMKNLKKTKSSTFFLKAVDPVALNIPSYPEIIKNPMDLGTMDAKLKDDLYPTVQDFVNDFNLIVNNCRTFNGEQHPVTTSVMSMEAYFKRMLEKLPSPDQPLPQKVAKRSSPAVKAPPRRDARAAAVVAPPPDPQTFALQADGVPTIRRDSSMTNRPARAIKPPSSREIPYAKPKRKEHQLELRFCEYVLDEIRGPRYAGINLVFMLPVDPVALNIPNYRQIIKHPMDLTTMGQKLKQGQYGNAREFRKDFELMVENCLTFNPQGNPVRDLAIQMRRQFDAIWSGKEKWERQHKPESQRATSASEDEDAGEDEEEEDDEPEDGKEQTIQALQKQLADMQSLISGMASGGTKAAKSKKSKVKSSSKQKVGSVSAAPKSRPLPPMKPKKVNKVKQVTYDEKQEISEAVGRMNDAQVAELTTIITQNCTKYANMDEMELEIDDLPNDVQALLLKYVRKIFGRPKGVAAADSPPDDGAFEDDGEFAPRAAGTGAGGKRKKHKPMGKREQQDTISALKGKLEQFNHLGTSGSESPNNSGYNATKAESSGDDESEESEEE
ncbi:hypothetical protein LTR36_010710 [Oleoguttula mirabilis]|uniref:Bromodomain-containing protein n=1 Tax=Oleoguttula mirabilis TaxID=1507867 RepID=A0AAV9JRD9_9PEZI|nr:hypothetical protein LTR36_010710 [Oleoguttula mirabilis]